MVSSRQALKWARAASAHVRDMLHLQRQTSQNGPSPTAQFPSLLAPCQVLAIWGSQKDSGSAYGSIPQFLCTPMGATKTGTYPSHQNSRHHG